MKSVTLNDIKKVIGNKFVKVQWQQAHVNEYGLTRVQVKQLATDILELIKNKIS